jgi:hypothetical protein
MSDRAIGEQAGREFLAAMRDRQRKAADKSYAVPGTVSAIDGALVAVRTEVDDTVGSSQLIAALGSGSLEVGDRGILIPITPDPKSGRVRYVFAQTGGGLRIEANTVAMINARPIWGLDFGPEFSLANEDAAGIDAHTDEVNISLAYAGSGGMYGTSNAPARDGHVHDGESMIKVFDGQSSVSTSGTNASTSTYNEVFLETQGLPAGEWDVTIFGTVEFSNSISGSGATARVKAPQLSGGLYGTSGAANDRFTVPFRGLVANEVGTFNIGVEYIARTSGTASAFGWWYIAIARRRT